jgi:hypothetical protein
MLRPLPAVGAIAILLLAGCGGRSSLVLPATLGIDGSTDASPIRTAPADTGVDLGPKTASDAMDEGNSSDASSLDQAPESAAADAAADVFDLNATGLDGLSDVVTDALPETGSLDADDAPQTGGAPDDASDAEVAYDSNTSEASTACSSDGGCAYVVPDGWTLVALTTNRGSACPSGFAQAGPADLYSYADTTGVCTCGACSITTQPVCQGGPINAYHDVHDATGSNTCGIADSPPAIVDGSGACATSGLMTGDYSTFDVAYDPGPALYGQCSAAAPMQIGQIRPVWAARTCAPDPGAVGCVGSNCTPPVPAGYRVCVTRPPYRVCPANSPFTQAMFLSTGFTFDYCGPCNCYVNATCWGKVELFSDTHCLNDDFDVSADGQCHAGPSASVSVNSYKYIPSAPANVSCTVGASSAVVTTTETLTACCLP